MVDPKTFIFLGWAEEADKNIRKTGEMKIIKQIRYKLVYKPVKFALRIFGYRLVRLRDRSHDASHSGSKAFGNFLSVDWERNGDSTCSTLLRDLILALEDKKIRAAIVQPIHGIFLKIAVIEEDRELVCKAVSNFINENNLSPALEPKCGDWHGGRGDSKYSACELISLVSRDSGAVLAFELEFWEISEDAYISPRRNLFAMKLWKDVASRFEIFSPGVIKDISEVLQCPHEQKINFPIDLVFTWVNADDPDWQELYKSYAPKIHTDGTSRARFHNRDELKYALRSWDSYAPFINNIYIVSNCAPPPWLNLSINNIRWVRHEEILPAEALPTFSSHAIESCIHKIDGLAEHFIYSNDDFLLTRPSKPGDFFYANGIAKVRIEPYGMVNGGVQIGHPDYLNAARNSNVLLEGTFSKTSTQLVTHSPQPIIKSIIFELEELYSQHFYSTIHSRFRTPTDIGVTAFLSAHYSILSGRAVPDERAVLLIQQNHDFELRLSNLISMKNGNSRKLPLSICLNDGADSHLNEQWNASVTEFLDAFYPTPSKFER